MPTYPALSEDEHACLNHWSMFGSAGYPVQKLGRGWVVNGFRGVGSFPSVYKTKRQAVEQWERFVALLRDRAAGRL